MPKRLERYRFGQGRRSRATKMETTSTWFALRNRVFRRIWLASVLSATFASAQEVTATWLMHELGAAYSLSLMATAASTPLFLFTLPAGVVADAVNRRALIIGAVLWQGTCSALLAAGAWTKVMSTHSVLGCICALGIGLAFSGPVWAAIVPDVVSKDELASAVTLGGVQLNIAAIVGPPLGGFLLPFLGIPVLFLISALAFLVVALVLLQWKQRRTQSSGPCESFKESLINLLRHAHNSSRIKMILFRNFLFSLVISVVPSLLPVIAFQELQCSAAQLGLFFTSVGIGSLAGAAFVLPSLRQRMSPNSIILIAMAILVSVLAGMTVTRTLPAVLVYSLLAGVAWALAGSELWLAGQRVIPGWLRGRMDAFLIATGQGGIALGSILLGTGAANLGLNLTLAAAAVMASIQLGLGYCFSINFTTKEGVDKAAVMTNRFRT
jgi:MFS family permease